MDIEEEAPTIAFSGFKPDKETLEFIKR